MKEINGRITILVNQDYTTIEVEDRDSTITFLRIKLTPEQLSSALSRLSDTKCESTQVYSLDKVGKKMQMSKEKVELPWEWYDLNRKELKDTVEAHLDSLAKNIGWLNYTYLSSQDSFVYSHQEKKFWVNALFRRWV